MEFDTHIKFETVCRLCIKQSPDMSAICGQKFMDMLKDIAPISLDEDDELPQQVCAQCICEIDRCYSFRTMIIHNDTSLRANLSYRKNNKGNFSNLRADEKDTSNGDVELMLYDVDVYIKEENAEDSDRNVDVKEEPTEKPVRPEEGLDGSQRKFACKICKKELRNSAALYQHTKIHTDINPQPCEICKKVLRNVQAFKRHMKIHSSDTTSFTCNICQKSFFHKSSLSLHKKIHSGIKPHTCPQCGKSFTHKHQLEDHFQRKHTDERPYMCTECGNTFALKGDLDKHMERHTGKQGPRQFACTQCDKKFYVLADLKSHVKLVHTEERPFQCDLCEKTFKLNSKLLFHKNGAHTTNKKYACQQCEKSFATSTGLKTHLRTHTGERPYVCKICGKSFSQTSSHATHMKRVHHINK